MHIKTNAVFPITAASDQGAKEGHFVDAAGVVMASAAAVPHGVILDGGGAGQTTSIAPCAGGFSGTLSVKLAAVPGNVVKGSRLVTVNDGTAKLDPGAGDRVVVAEAQEAGAADELIEAVLISPPIVIAGE